MGNNHTSQLTPSIATAGVSSYFLEFGNVEYEKSIGNSRFIRSYRGRILSSSPYYAQNPQARPVVVVKIYLKPLVSQLSYKRYLQQFQQLRSLLKVLPNVLPMRRELETDRAIYLERQFIFSNLYDRISNRPFLASIERSWLAFQLCLAVNSIHELGVCHGDIKSENVLITSWNWLFLADFASHKPAYIPEDNPSDFSYFFDTSGRRICHIAPERFDSKKAGNPEYSEALTPEMDIFALGCVIAELFLDGTSLFTFSQLLQYRSGCYDPHLLLEKIEDEHIRSLIKEMIDISPENRKHLGWYLDKYRNKAFPDYFYNFFHKYLHSMVANTPGLGSISDRRILQIYRDSELISQRITRDGHLLYLPLICSCARSCTRVKAKRALLHLLRQMCGFIEDSHRLNRILPHVVVFLKDENAGVRALAIETIVYTLNGIQSLSLINTAIFAEYILPYLRICVIDEEPQVRLAYARALAKLCPLALHFSELAQQYKEYSLFHQGNDESTRKELQEHITTLLMDPEPTVRRALLTGIAHICALLGRQRANDLVLSHTITYLNDRDWQLRYSFFESMVGLATYVGSRSIEEYFLPLMIQALTDPEEFVVARVLRTMTTLAQLGLFHKPMVRDLASLITPFGCHPNPWLRKASLDFINVSSSLFNLPDTWCFLYPTIRQLLRCDLSVVTPEKITQMLKPPLDRQMFDVALQWAGKSRSFLETVIELREKGGVFRELTRARTSVDDDEYLEKLRGQGMNPEDEEKIYAMREYLLKLARSRQTLTSNEPLEFSSGTVLLKNLGVTPNTVFLNRPDPPTTTTSTVASPTLKEDDVQSNRTIEAEDGVKTKEEPLPTIRKIKAERDQLMDDQRERLPIGKPRKSQRRELEAEYSKARAAVCSSSYVAQAQMQIPHAKPSEEKFSPVKPMTTPLDDSKNSWIPGISTLLKCLRIHKEGADDNLRELLHNFATRAFPHPFPELGPVLTSSLMARHRNALRSSHANGQAGWSPQGIQIAHLAEHTGPINQICLSPDHAFFATCSDDGTIKIWDCERLLKHVNNRARLSYSGLVGQIKCLTFIEARHALVAASNTGEIQVLRILFEKKLDVSRYMGVRLIKSFQLQQGEHAIALSHYTTETKSVLVVGTNKSRIYGLCLLDMEAAWTLTCPANYGLLTSLVVDPTHAWLLTGTAHGVLTLWDLRFAVQIKSWFHHSRSRIWKLLPYLNSKLVLVAAGRSEVSVWDVERSCCLEVFAVEENKEDAMFHDTYEPIPFDPEELLQLVCAGYYSGESVRVMRGIAFSSKCVFTTGDQPVIRCWDLTDVQKTVTIGATKRVLYSSYQVGEVVVHVESPAVNHSMPRVVHLGNRAPSPALSETTAATSGSPATIRRTLEDKDVAGIWTDLQLSELPQPILISSGYDGVLRVFV